MPFSPLLIRDPGPSPVTRGIVRVSPATVNINFIRKETVVHVFHGVSQILMAGDFK